MTVEDLKIKAAADPNSTPPRAGTFEAMITVATPDGRVFTTYKSYPPETPQPTAEDATDKLVETARAAPPKKRK